MAPGRTARAGARGGRGTARGTTRGTTARGRGRGRGRSATATSNDAPASDIAENASAESQPKSTGTSSDTIIPDDMGNSSSSQAQREPPAAATTPTESSTPATASKPAPAKPATAGSARGAAKFLPRATRRSQLDREALAQKELQKQETRAAIDARLKRMGRGRGGARRSRGGAPGGYQDRIIKASAGGLGPFSEVPQSQRAANSRARLYDYGSSGGGGGGGGSGGGYGGYSNAKSEPGTSGGQNGFSLSSGRPTGKRLNTDALFEVIEIEDDEESNKGKEKTPTLLPKGLRRDKTREQQVEVATEAELEAAAVAKAKTRESTADSEDIFMSGSQPAMEDDAKVWAGAPEARRIKVEGEEITEIDTLAAKRAVREQPAEDGKPTKKPKYVYNDIEEMMYAMQLRDQRQLFAINDPQDFDNNALTMDPDELPLARPPPVVPGNLYLFQFPPILPPLHVGSNPGPQKSRVKDEPSDDIVMLDSAPQAPGESVDLTGDGPQVKQEGGAEDSGAKISRDAGSEHGGFVGKLIVRKSGKMEIDYGGMTFEAEAGIRLEFLRTAVLTEMDDVKKPDGYAGTAYDMGQITGKFVATPKWSEEDDWDVKSQDMPPNGVERGR